MLPYQIMYYLDKLIMYFCYNINEISSKFFQEIPRNILILHPSNKLHAVFVQASVQTCSRIYYYFHFNVSAGVQPANTETRTEPVNSHSNHLSLFARSSSTPVSFPVFTDDATLIISKGQDSPKCACF
jgi:hypothetical protein